MIFRLTLSMFFLMFFQLGLLQSQAPGRSGRGPHSGGVKGTIKGMVIDQESGTPLEYATITIYSKRDSSIIGGSITDETGKFEVQTRPGFFFASVEYIAFQKVMIDSIRMGRDGSEVQLAVIELAPHAAALDEIEVRAEKSSVEMSLDKRIFNVGKDLVSQGGTAENILNNVPSVQVDVEGQVSLRGSENVRILINGKPSRLIGGRDASGLKSIPSNLIERVEVITNPSARYQAEGMSGIINIVLRKDQQQGLNGSFDLTAGLPSNYGAAMSLNYRKDKLNWFLNYGLSYRKNPGESNLYQEVYRNDSTFITEQTSDRSRGGLSNSVRFGADYFFNKKNTLTAAFVFRKNDEDNSNKIVYNDFLSSLDMPVGITRRTDDEFEDEIDLRYSLQYEKILSSKKHKLTADVRYEESTEKEGSDLRESYFDASDQLMGIPQLEQRSNNEESEKRWLTSIDYEQPIGTDGVFELGYWGSFREITNDFLVEELENGLWLPFAGLSNNFVYDENVLAGYGIFGNKFGKISFQAGLRLEYSDIRTNLLQTQEKNSQTYTNLFPSGHLGYEISKTDAMQVSYSRRIIRPRFHELNPFFTFSDARNYWSGNPDLKPQFSDSYELQYIKYWDKGSLSSAIYYRHTTGVIERIRRVDEDGNSATRPENLSVEDALGLELTYAWTILPDWKINGDVNFFRAERDGNNVAESLQSKTVSWFSRLNSVATLWKAWDVQLNTNYRAPRETTQGKRKAYISSDLAIGRDILKNNGTITLSVRDIFNSRRRRYISEGANFYTEGDFQWRSRVVTLNFNYRLNQKKSRSRGRGRPDGGDMDSF